MTNDNDHILIKKYLNGNEKSFEDLIRSYLKPIYSFAYRYVGNTQDAEDITQEVFVKVWRHLKKSGLRRIYSGAGFDPKKGSFKTWIFSIAKNTTIDFMRKRKTVPFSKFEDKEGKNALIENLVDPAPLPNELFERADLGKMLNSAINQLALPYRMVLFLRYNDHFNFREIAETLGEPLHTVKSQHRRALILLRKLLS